ncbi:MAG: diphosphomevalonate decarboxylase [Anaerolineae bacterium]|nr:diphosphomevalonate decarboxylase [Anaerolineae bacterium]
MGKATAVANPNIALVKHWGKADEALSLPANPSLSMNLAALTTVTTVEFRPGRAADVAEIDGRTAAGQALDRVAAHLDRVRALAGSGERARVASRNDFPAGTGLASSSSAFAALTLAAAQAAGLSLDEAGLSRLARLGSGSACRSVPAGFALWEKEEARQIAPPEHWDLRDVIAIVTDQPKAVGSHDGHILAPTSPLHEARLAAVPGWLAAVKDGLARQDLAAMGPAIEADALAMHGVMMTSQPSLLYWLPATVAVLQAVRAWRAGGLEVYFTLDAGPNVHCLCRAAAAVEVEKRLQVLPGVQEVIASGPGDGVRLVSWHLF